MFLESFWDKERVSKWKELLLRDSMINVYQVFNLISLDIAVNRLWAFGVVALRPISVNQDQTEMQVAFHWLPLQKRLGDIKQKDKVSILQNPFQDLQYRPVETPGDNLYVIARLEDTTTPTLVSSGHIFTVKTDDKYERPLPSFDLLELRWHLSRIAAFQGTGDNEDGYYDYEYKFDPESGGESDPDSDYEMTQSF